MKLVDYPYQRRCAFTRIQLNSVYQPLTCLYFEEYPQAVACLAQPINHSINLSIRYYSLHLPIYIAAGPIIRLSAWIVACLLICLSHLLYLCLPIYVLTSFILTFLLFVYYLKTTSEVVHKRPSSRWLASYREALPLGIQDRAREENSSWE